MSNPPDIEKFRYATITLDIFDTVLLRKIWPEELQFLKIAELWAPEVSKILGHEVSGYELYTYRRDIRRVLHAGKKYNAAISKEDEPLDHAILGIQEWFGRIIDAVADRYDYEVKDAEREKLLKKLIKLELEVEKANLFVNRELIAWLRKIKLAQPKVKVYFLSDMYLRASDIKALLEYFEIADLFDSGETSSDLKRGKWSGKLYTYIQQDKISVGTNLHIGDNYYSDVVMATSFGSEAVHYNSFRNRVYRPLKTKYGYSKLRRVEANNRKAIAQQYKKQFLEDESRKSTSSTAQYIGSLFAPPLVAYLLEMAWFSAFEKMQMIAVSSEAKSFKKFSKRLSSRLSNDAKISYFPDVNRKQTTLALVGSMFGNAGSSAAESTIARLLRYEQGMVSQADIYSFVSDTHPKQAMPDLLLNKLTDAELGRLVKSLIVTHDPEKIKVARAKIDAMVDVLNSPQIFMMDVGWNGTVQAMLQQYMLSQKSRMVVNGIYMGFRANSRRKLSIRGCTEGWLMKHIGIKPDSDFFVPDIWEFIYTNKDYGTGFNELVQRGLDDGVEFYKKHVHASPMEFYLAANNDLRRLFTRPHISEIKLLGMLTFDAGFVDVKNARLVDMSSTKLTVFKSLLLHPKKFVDYASKPYCWTAGYVRFYRVTLLAALLIKATQLIKIRSVH